jgi:plastocyanin
MIFAYRVSSVCLLTLSLFFFSACTKSPAPETDNSAKTAFNLPPIDPATTATISGVVTFSGTVPKPQQIDMSADPACKGDTTWRPIVVDNGKLANVLVYVKEGLGDRTFEAPATAVTIEQKGCRYIPHVAAAMAGQTVEFLDQDPTMHNIHPMPKNNPEWNQAEQPGGKPIRRTFDNPELMIPIKCNQHPWMKMYLNVMSNPFYAVTGPDGAFTLKGLPPGTYTIAAVHEKLGEKTQTVTVAPKEDKQGVAFAYR